MSDLEKIKEIVEQMPESPEKQQALQTYSNLKTFEIMADSFERLINPESGRKGKENKKFSGIGRDVFAEG